MACGDPLARACPACGEVAPPEAQYCMACGAALGGQPASASPEERRTVTVVFADLTGYTAVAERLDPEAVREIADRSLRRLAQEVERYGGTIDKYIGDNVMAIFGAPVTHEDDAERAVRAGLEMQAAMTEINAELEARHSERFALRVGINTGEVLAGAVAGAYTVSGDAVNVASRLQSAGEPGSIIVGEATQRATCDRIEYVALDPLTLKGKAEPVAAWSVVGLREAPARPAAARLVGRVAELGLLDSHYLRVIAERRPQLVTIFGDAGIGKTRLLREFSARVAAADDAPILRQGRCLPYGSGTVYWALGEILREECGIEDVDSAQAAWSKLERRVATLVDDPGESAHIASIVGRLLGMESADSAYEETDDAPERVREAFFAAARTVIEGMARDRPLLLAFEDVHWADQGMLDLVEHVAQWARGPVLIVALARHELLDRRSGWGAGRRATQVFLEPLSLAETRELVAELLPGTGHERAATAVAERVDGNPLFAEEMARRLADERDTQVAELPDTVHALLAARIDGLAPFERRVVQQAAVIGRTFWPDALVPLAEAEGADLQGALNSLAEKDIIVPGDVQRLAGASELAFKHVLIRDVAYGMLPRAMRARKHFEIGRFVEERAGERADEVVALLAEHYGRAAALGTQIRLDELELEPMRGAALRHLEAAGDAAARLFSNEEALEHYAGATALLVEHDEDVQARVRVGEKQGDVALLVGRPETALEVWRGCLDHHRTHEDLPRIGATLRRIGMALTQQGERRAAIEHYQQGMNLLKDGPPSLELVRLYEDAAWLYVQSGDNMLAIYASEKALRIAQQLGEAGAVSRAHGIFGRVFSRIGDAEHARENLGRAIELAREGTDPLEEILALIALANHLEVAEADYPAADRTYRDALGVAKRVGDVPSQVELHASIAMLAVFRADWDEVERLGEDSAALAERAGLVLKQCLPLALEGILSWRAGEWSQSVELYERAAALAEEVGWSEVAFTALYGLAIVQRDLGEPAAALASLDHALEISERAGMTVQGALALGQRAVLLRLGDRADEALAAAGQLAGVAERLRSPVCDVATLEAEAATAPAAQAPELLAGARDAWTALGRPLDAARCDLVAALLLRDDDAARAREAFEAAAVAYEALNVPHLAGHARELAVG
jgi:adenylate cyclase